MDEDSGGYPDVDSDERNLKLDRHTSFPVIYSSPSRVVYAHHASQADPLENTSEENYDIGEHAPGPPIYQNPTVFIRNTKKYEVSNEVSKVSKEEAKLPKSLFQSSIDSGSLEYVPPPNFNRPPLSMRSVYMNPKPIPVVNRGYFSDFSVKRINNLNNDHQSIPSSPTYAYNNPSSPVNRIGNLMNSQGTSSPSIPAFNYNNPAPALALYSHPTPAPVVFSGPNSNAAIYSKPVSAQVVYKYALPSRSISKDEEHFHLNEKTINYEDDNKPEPMIYDSASYYPLINGETTFAPYIYSDLISPSNAFEDSFSSQSIYKYPSSNQISQGFAKSEKSDRLLNLYANPKQYSIEPSYISSFEKQPVSKIFENPSPIKNVFVDSKHDSEIYKDLEDSSIFDDMESKINKNPVQITNFYIDPDIELKTYKDPVPKSNIYINSEDNSDVYKDLIESSTFDDIEYEDVDHDIIDAIPVTHNEPKSESLSNNVKEVQVKNKSITFNTYQTDMKSKSSEEIIIKLPEIKAERTSTLPKNNIPETKVSQNMNIDTADEAIRVGKMPQQAVKQIKSTTTTTNRMSTFPSLRSQQRGTPNYSQRIAELRASLREQQRRRFRDRSSEEKISTRYFINRYKYRTRGSTEKVISRRPLGRMLYRQSSDDKSSEESIYSRRRTMWGRRKQSRRGQSSEEDDVYKNKRTRIHSRLNTRRLPEKTTTIKPESTTVDNKRQLLRGRSRNVNRNKNRNPGRQSLQCFLMSIVRNNYRC